MDKMVCAECGGGEVFLRVEYAWCPHTEAWVETENAVDFAVTYCAHCGEVDRDLVLKSMTPGEIVKAEMERVRREKADG